MCLVNNGLRLSREAYTQGTLMLRRARARKRLATRIWEMGVNSKAVRWSPLGDPTAIRCRAPSAGRGPGSRRQTRAAVRGTEGKVRLGSKAPRRRWWGRRKEQPHREEGGGSKRSAKSEVEEEGDDRTRVRIFQPPQKRARNLIAGH